MRAALRTTLKDCCKRTFALLRINQQGSIGVERSLDLATLGLPLLPAAACCRQLELAERSVEQLRGALESEKRSAAATHRRMVAENAELIRRLREAKAGGAGSGGGAARNGGGPRCAGAASPSRQPSFRPLSSSQAATAAPGSRCSS